MSDEWKAELESVLHQIPGYDPWTQAGDSWLDHEAACDAINFFNDRLKHVEGSARGQPFTLRPWQAAIVGNIFGWKRKDDAGRIVRRYRKVFAKISRGNGKTPLASGIVLYGLFHDREPGAQNFLAAGAKDQAGLLFRNAKGMLEQDEELKSKIRIYGGESVGGLRSIVLLDDPLTSVKVIPADAAGQHGGIPHIVVVDELHVQENRDLLDVFETGMAKKTRSQPLLVMITTSDFDRPSICNEVDSYAHIVRDNGGDKTKPGFDPEFLPVIYELGPDDEWRDEDLWKKANPNLDVSVSLESMRKAKKKAEEQPAFENTFRRLNLNQKTSQNVRIVPMSAWDKCGEIKFDFESLKGRTCFGGMDLASVEDLASYVLVFPLEDERIAVLVRCFCPEEKVAARARQRIPYDVWERQGHLTATPGNQIDYTQIEERFAADATTYQIAELGLDKHDATQMGQRLRSKHGEQFVVEVPQTTFMLSAPLKDILRLIKLGKVIHGNNPVLRWAASNVAGKFFGRLPAGAKLEDHLDKVPVMPSKQLSSDKIDPFTALVTARARMMVNPNGGASVYESRGVISL